MPKAFDECVRRGGRVRTKSLPKGKYMRVCSKGGNSYAGHVKTAKKQSLSQAIKEYM